MKLNLVLAFSILYICGCIDKVTSLQCYECDSKDDGFCETLEDIDTISKSSLVDCYESKKSNSVGHMCVKITRNTPVTLYSRGWKRVTRRCATKTDIITIGGCRYFLDQHGLYVEVCYCSDNDRCNSSPTRVVTNNKLSLLSLSLLLIKYL